MPQFTVEYTDNIKADANIPALLQKVNEVINIVNRIVTADGLFQRVALIRSMARDYKYAWKAITAPWVKDQTPPKDADVIKGVTGKPLPTVASDIRAYLRDGSGPDAALLDEMAAQWRIYLRS